MEEELIKIERKDGTVFERRRRPKEFDVRLNMRVNKEIIEAFKEIAEEEGIKYQTLIRNILKEFVEKYR